MDLCLRFEIKINCKFHNNIIIQVVDDRGMGLKLKLIVNSPL